MNESNFFSHDPSLCEISLFWNRCPLVTIPSLFKIKGKCEKLVIISLYSHKYFQKINVLHLALTWQWEFLEPGNSLPSLCPQVELRSSEGRARNGRDKRARTRTLQARLTASLKPILTTKTNGAVYSFTWICRLQCRKLNISVRS